MRLHLFISSWDPILLSHRQPIASMLPPLANTIDHMQFPGCGLTQARWPAQKHLLPMHRCATASPMSVCPPPCLSPHPPVCPSHHHQKWVPARLMRRDPGGHWRAMAPGSWAQQTWTFCPPPSRTSLPPSLQCTPTHLFQRLPCCTQS